MPATAAAMAKIPEQTGSTSVMHTTPPWISNPSVKYLTVKEFAHIYRRSERTIRLWCLDGTLIDFGFSLYQDLGGKWWISAASPDNI